MAATIETLGNDSGLFNFGMDLYVLKFCGTEWAVHKFSLAWLEYENAPFRGLGIKCHPHHQGQFLSKEILLGGRLV